MMRRRYKNNTWLFNGSKYMTIEPLEDIELYFQRTSVEYTKDGILWHPLKGGMVLRLQTGELCYFRSDIQKGDFIYPCRVKGRFNLKGNCMSLIFGDNADINYDLKEYPGVFQYLFSENDVVNVEEGFLPATTLGINCYNGMFLNCKQLVTAPYLLAKKLVQFCYNYMFLGCTNLSHIKMLATNLSPDQCSYGWVDGVSSTGTFVKSKDATWDTTPGALGYNGVPAGWTVVNDGEEEGGNDFGIEFPLYLTFDRCESFFMVETCFRDADELGVKLYSLVKDVVDKYGEGDIFIVGEQILDMLGIELYIENGKVYELWKEGNAYFWGAYHDKYNVGRIHADGEITFEH